MKLKNLTLWRREGGDLTEPSVRFEPCGPSDEIRCGFVPVADGRLLAQRCLAYRIERKRVPPEAVEREAAKRAKAEEADSGHKPGAKRMKQIKEEARFELLPRAFPKASTVAVLLWDDLVAVGTTTAADLDLVASALVAEYPGMVLQPMPCDKLGLAMTAWARDVADLPEALAYEGRAKLENHGADAAIRNPGFSHDAGLHGYLGHGYVVTEIGLEFDDTTSFVLTDCFEVKGLALHGLTSDPDEGGEDGELLLWRGAVRALVDEVAKHAT